jgi:ketopantoate reductase
MQINKVLILGAGAVGQVIGTHLRLSGCDVSFWVRPSQIETLESKGLTLHNVKTDTELHISAPQVITSPTQGESYDAVFICVRSEQLDEALSQIQSAFDSLDNMVIIPIQPGRDDGLKVFRALSEAVVVPMSPAFSAYLSEADRIEYLALKQTPSLVGPPYNETLHVRDEIVRLLQQGGIPTKGVNDLEADTRFISVALQCLVVALGLSEFSLKKLSHNKGLLNMTAQAITEGVEITRQDLGFIPLKYKPLQVLNGDGLKAFLWTLNRSKHQAFFESMWAAHARKIQEQSYGNLEELVTLSLQQSKNPPLALTALNAMTPSKIGEFLKSNRAFNGKKSNKAKLKQAAVLTAGAFVLMRLLKRKKA